MTLSDETIRTLLWVFVMLAGIQASATYMIVRLLTTGKGLFERRENDGYRTKVVGLERDR